MQTITRRNNWRTLSDSEIDKAMPWMKITHRYRMSVAIGLLLMFGIPVIAFPVLCIVNSGWTEFLKTAWIYNHVESGDRALVIKYNYKKLKDPLADLDFIPAIES